MTLSLLEVGPNILSERPKPHHPVIEGPVFRGNHEAPRGNILAFDLESERSRSLDMGERYRQTFVDNSHFYAGETYIKGRATMYEYKVTDDNRLVYPGDVNIDAIESFRKPLGDISRPAWLRDRDRKDLEVIQAISSQIPDAKIGTTWIAASPSIPDSAVELTDREKWGYGRHSFLFLHQLQIDPTTRDRKLVCRALRHYLPNSVQTELINSLSDRVIPSDKELHGFLTELSPSVVPDDFRIQDSLHIAHVHSVGKKVADENGVMYWQDERVSGDSKDIEEHEREMMGRVRNIDWWLNDIYTDILNLGDTPKISELQAIQNKFRGWESVVKNIASGEKLDERLLEYQPIRRVGKMWQESIDYTDPRVAYIQMAMNMQGGLGTCGMGSGFGNVVSGTINPDAVSSIGIHGVMSMWAGVAVDIQGGGYRKETATHYESYQCPGCKSWLSGERINDKKSWRTKCDHCGEKLNC